MLEEEIVPQLEQDVPNQPSDEELSKDPWLSRFVIVFDREGYSLSFPKDVGKADFLHQLP